MQPGNACGEGIILWTNKGKGARHIPHEVSISILNLKYFRPCPFETASRLEKQTSGSQGVFPAATGHRAVGESLHREPGPGGPLDKAGEVDGERLWDM